MGSAAAAAAAPSAGLAVGQPGGDGHEHGESADLLHGEVVLILVAATATAAAVLAAATGALTATGVLTAAAAGSPTVIAPHR